VTTFAFAAVQFNSPPLYVVIPCLIILVEFSTYLDAPIPLRPSARPRRFKSLEEAVFGAGERGEGNVLHSRNLGIMSRCTV
jgi:hypothetical protein